MPRNILLPKHRSCCALLHAVAFGAQERWRGTIFHPTRGIGRNQCCMAALAASPANLKCILFRTKFLVCLQLSYRLNNLENKWFFKYFLIVVLRLKTYVFSNKAHISERHCRSQQYGMASGSTGRSMSWVGTTVGRGLKRARAAIHHQPKKRRSRLLHLDLDEVMRTSYSLLMKRKTRPYNLPAGRSKPPGLPVCRKARFRITFSRMPHTASSARRRQGTSREQYLPS